MLEVSFIRMRRIFVHEDGLAVGIGAIDAAPVRHNALNDGEVLAGARFEVEIHVLAVVMEYAPTCIGQIEEGGAVLFDQKPVVIGDTQPRQLSLGETKAGRKQEHYGRPA